MVKIIMILIIPFLVYDLSPKGKPDLVIPLGHSEAIDSWLVSPDEQYLATGSRDRTFKVWNIHYQKEIRTFRGHQRWVTDICFSSEGQAIYSASTDGFIRLWEPSTGKVQKIFDTRRGEKFGSVRSITPGRNKNILISAGLQIDIWDCDTGKILRTIQEPAQTIVLTPDENSLLSANVGKLTLYDVETGQVFKRFRQFHVADITTKPEVYISKDGKYTFTRLRWSTGIQIWDMLSGEVVQNLTNKNTNALTLNPDGSFIAVAYHPIWEKDYVEIYDAKSFKPITKIQCPENLRNNAVVVLRFVSPNQLMIIHENNCIFIVDIHRPIVAKQLDLSRLTTGISDCVPDSTTQSIYFGDYQGYIKNIDLQSLKITLAANKGKGIVDKLFLLPLQSHQLLAAYSDGSVKLWQTKKLQLIDSFTPHKDFITSLCISPQSDYVISSSWDHTIMVTPLSGNKKTKPLFFQDRSVTEVLYLPDRGMGFSADPSTIKRWDISSNRVLWELKPKMKTHSLLYVPPHNRLIAGGGELEFLYQDPDARLISIDATTGQLQSAYEGKELGFHTVSGALWYKPIQYDQILLTTTDGKINCLDMLNQNLIFSRQGHIGKITAIREGIDPPRFFFTSGVDGTICIWNRTEGDEILKIINFADNKQFAFATPDGYFYASKETVRNIYFVKGLQIYTFDQFDLQYNRPDIILERLGKAPKELIFAYRKAWEKRLHKMGFNPNNFEKERSFNVPQIILAANTETFVETSTSTHTISFTANDNLYKLDRLFIQVNGVPLFGLKGKSLSKQASRSLQFTETIPLSSGKNIIKISVLNEKGVESLAEQIEVIYTPQTVMKPTWHIIAIGVSKFVQSNYNLTYADKDARDLVEIFRKVSDVNSVKVHLLTNEQATRSNILQLRYELEKTGVDDRVILFIASHGVLDDDLDYYIAMHDMDFSNPRNGGLRFDELENLLDSIPARNKSVLIDACHSGEVDKEENILFAENIPLPKEITSRGFKAVKSKYEGIGLANSFELMKELFADLRRNNGSVVISSAC